MTTKHKPIKHGDETCARCRKNVAEYTSPADLCIDCWLAWFKDEFEVINSNGKVTFKDSKRKK